jgi:hypothetical protein
MRDLDPEFIQSELGELLRIAASINDGYGSATFLLERFRSAAQLQAPSRGYAVGAMVGFGIPVRAASTGYWSAENPTTNSNASFTRVQFGSTAGGDGTRKS